MVGPNGLEHWRRFAGVSIAGTRRRNGRPEWTRTIDTEPYELVTFKLYKSQLPVVEQALETASLMLGSDKSRGYCLQMICADFLAGTYADGSAPDVLLRSMLRLFQLADGEQQREFLAQVHAAV